MAKKVTACVILIGNEILSGRTEDENLSWLAISLNELGITLAHARVITDDIDIIVSNIRACSGEYDYVFTTGGIGPTHDDITTESIAKAFNVPVIRHKEAEKRILAHYPPADINEARLKMANTPEGAILIDNPISSAPGYQIENVFVMAGVPSIMRSMFDCVKPLLSGGEPMLSRSINVYMSEGVLAQGVTEIDQKFPEVEIGSYPMIQNEKLATALVLRSTSVELLGEAFTAMQKFIATTDAKIIEVI